MIVWLVMNLLAIYDVSKAVNERKIYDNMLTAIIFGAGALAAGAVTFGLALSRVLSLGSFVGTRFVPPVASSVPVGTWVGVIGIAAVGLVAVVALIVVSAVFVRRSYDSMGTKLNVGRFKTAGLLYLIGAATAIVGVGFVLIFVADILLALSFFSIQGEAQLPRAATSTTQTPATPPPPSFENPDTRSRVLQSQDAASLSDLFLRGDERPAFQEFRLQIF